MGSLAKTDGARMMGMRDPGHDEDPKSICVLCSETIKHYKRDCLLDSPSLTTTIFPQ